MIPTREKVTVEKAYELDDFGRKIDGDSFEYNCRIDYRTERVRTDNGEEKVAKVTILIKGFADVTIEDTLKWTDQFGEHEERPIVVNPLKDLSSKLIFTKVVI